MEHFQFALTQGIEQRLYCCALSCCLRLMLRCGAILAKRGKHRVQIGCRSLLALLIPEPGKQNSHLRPFIHEAADVALRFSQLQSLGKEGERLSLFAAHGMSQSLQYLYFDDVAPAFLLFCTSLERFQERKGLHGPLLGQHNACVCHILAFTGKWGMHSGLLEEFPCPVGGTF